MVELDFVNVFQLLIGYNFLRRYGPINVKVCINEAVVREKFTLSN